MIEIKVLRWISQHNTKLKADKDLKITSQGSQGSEYISYTNIKSEYRHSLSSFSLDKASTNNIRGTDRKARPPTWELQASPGQWGTRRRSRLRRGTHAPGLHRQLQRPIRQNRKRGSKAGEYLIYPRVLHPATKLMHYQMDWGRLYSGLQDSKYKDKREYARPIED